LIRLVVDASVAAKWVLTEDDSRMARRVVEQARLLAPDLLWAELGSLLWRRHRVGELSASEAREMLLTLRAFPIRTYAMFPLLPLALEIALTLGHSVYDCVYLALADHEDCRVVTADRRLQNAVSSGPLAQSVMQMAELT
jgi:predicted nucleic acid-binding protein